MSDKTIQSKTTVSRTVSKDIGKIKDYKILGVIGEGGMGKVYKAIHPTLKREIILKELKIRDKETRERFLREAKVMLDFRNENIVQFYDHFKEGNSHYIAMEYIKGLPLNTLIKQSKQITPTLALFILYQAAIGLHHAHTKKVIHRDIKPHNILISETGDVKIIDFGIAAQKNQLGEGLTAPGTVIGTPAYMSPEQFSSSKEISFQSDIYSLGVVFYEMLTGNKPYKNEFSSEVIESISRGKHVSVSKFVKNVPPVVKKILNKMFIPDVKKRYKDLRPVIKILRRYFKSYNPFELKASLRCLLQNNKDISCYPFYTRHTAIVKKKKIVAKIVLALTILTMFTTWFFGTYKQYEWLGRNKYGKVNLEFNKANMDISETFIKVNDKYYNIPHSKKNAEKNVRRSFYLKKGYNEISVNSGSYKITRKIDVLPISIQKKALNSKDGMEVGIKIYNLSPKEVMLSLRFWDSLNPDKYLFQFDNYTELSDRLQNESDFLIIWDQGLKRNVSLKEYVIRKINYKTLPFYSNQDYAFIVTGFEKDGIKYDNRRFKLKFGLDERTVVAHIPLAPVGATIRIYSQVKSIPLFINENNYGLVYQNDEYTGVKYSSLKGKPYKDGYIFEYIIPPGIVKIKIGSQGKVQNINLKSDSVYDISVKKDKSKFVY